MNAAQLTTNLKKSRAKLFLSPSALKYANTHAIVNINLKLITILPVVF